MQDRPVRNYLVKEHTAMHTTTHRTAKIITFNTAAALLGACFAVAMSASADTGLGYGAMRGGYDEERHEAVEATLEGGDYEAWVALMDGRGRVTEVVTEDNFDTFVAMHEAMEAGDMEEAQELREELGLGLRPQDGSGYRGKHGMAGGDKQAGNMHQGAGSGDGANNRWGN